MEHKQLIKKQVIFQFAIFCIDIITATQPLATQSLVSIAWHQRLPDNGLPCKCVAADHS
jgi:hypothetical protein